jgi:hypothetical protein
MAVDSVEDAGETGRYEIWGKASRERVRNSPGGKQRGGAGEMCTPYNPMRGPGDSPG